MLRLTFWDVLIIVQSKLCLLTLHHIKGLSGKNGSIKTEQDFFDNEKHYFPLKKRPLLFSTISLFEEHMYVNYTFT